MAKKGEPERLADALGALTPTEMGRAFRRLRAILQKRAKSEPQSQVVFCIVGHACNHVAETLRHPQWFEREKK